MGAGCGNTDATAPQCLTQVGCTLTLTSAGSAGSGLNGSVSLDGTGNFTGGAITEGTGGRSGCTGTWQPGNSALVVDCGGMGSSQSCIATLTQTSLTCM
jgi:hypothetical protein